MLDDQHCWLWLNVGWSRLLVVIKCWMIMTPGCDQMLDDHDYWLWSNVGWSWLLVLISQIVTLQTHGYANQACIQRSNLQISIWGNLTAKKSIELAWKSGLHMDKIQSYLSPPSMERSSCPLDLRTEAHFEDWTSLWKLDLHIHIFVSHYMTNQDQQSL